MPTYVYFGLKPRSISQVPTLLPRSKGDSPMSFVHGLLISTSKKGEKKKAEKKNNHYRKTTVTLQGTKMPNSLILLLLCLSKSATGDVRQILVVR